MSSIELAQAGLHIQVERRTIPKNSEVFLPLRLTHGPASSAKSSKEWRQTRRRSKSGPGMDLKTQMSPLVSDEQQRHVRGYL
jgi:hypothetical protein